MFLKRSIQPTEARKPSIPRSAAACRAFSFSWGQSMDALAVRACLRHAERMVSSSSHVEDFRDFWVLYKTVTHNMSNLSLFQTIDSPLCLMPIPTNHALTLDSPEIPHEHQLWLILAAFGYSKHFTVFLHFHLISGHFHNKWKVLASVTTIVEH